MFNRLYVRIWLAVVLAVAVLTLLVGWIWRMTADPPMRDVVLQNEAGQIIGRGHPRRGLDQRLSLVHRPEQVLAQTPCWTTLLLAPRASPARRLSQNLFRTMDQAQPLIQTARARRNF